MPKSLPLTSETLASFAEFARASLEQGRTETLRECLDRFVEIEDLKQALKEVNGMPEAPAGCGSSREEIVAQYEARLERLMGG